MTPKWPGTLQGQRYIIHVLLVFPSPKFWSVSPYDRRFPRYHTFYKSTSTPILNALKRAPPKKKKKKNKNIVKIHVKIKNLNFHNSLHSFGETLLRSMPKFWAAYLLYTFRQYVVWFFSPICSHVNEKEKMAQIQNLNFTNHCTNLGRYPP